MPPADPADPAKTARDQAMSLLAVRNRSQSELCDRLLQKGHPEDLVSALLERLTASGLLDDGRFARERARSLVRNNGWGPRKLRADLASRGVAAGLVEEAVTEAYGSESCEGVMRREVRKRFGEQVLDPEADGRLRSRAYRFLLGRGFEPEQIQDLLV